MSIKFACVHCGHHLKAAFEQSGKRCKCPRCRRTLTVPAPAPLPDSPPAAATASRGPRRGKWLRRVLGGGVAAAVLVAGVFVGVTLYGSVYELDQKLGDLAGDVPQARSAALLWLATTPPQDARRAQVTAVLEPLIFEGDARHDLDPDLVLRAYLHWADKDSVPSLIRMTDNSALPHWGPRKTRLVMEALGNLHDPRAADVLAAKLRDPQLRDQAVDSLKLLGPAAQRSVLDYLFADAPTTRQRAGDLLASYGTRPEVIVAEGQRLLQSGDPAARRGAAVWLAANAPQGGEHDGVARALAALLDDLSPEGNGVALRALKLWATPACLPQVAAFARRQQKAGDGRSAANNSALIDVLALFADESAAEAIALQLKNPDTRDLASQALIKLGPVATTAVLQYLDHPDEGVRKAARGVCRVLNVSDARRLEQTLADVADTTRKGRVRVALGSLARLRPDDASRVKVSQALNVPLLDPDPAVRAEAFDALRVWATRENTGALVRLLGDLTGENTEGSRRTIAAVVQVLIGIGPDVQQEVAPLLRSSDGLLRRQACYVLAEVGAGESLQPLDDAGKGYLSVDNEFYELTRLAIAKITARQ
jgi:hypothetical protein